MGRAPARRSAGRGLVAAAILLAAGPALGDGLGAYVEVDFIQSQQKTTDSSGRTTISDSITLPQRYRLYLDKQFAPTVQLNANGFYEWTPGWGTVDGLSSDVSANRWSVFASMVLGPPVLNVTPYYGRRQEWVDGTTAGVSSSSPTLINQYYGLFAGWNPFGLPLLSLRIGRTEDWDAARSFRDNRADEIIFTATYNDVENLLLQYGLRYLHNTNYINGVVSTDLNQAAQVVWTGSFFERTLSTSVNYQVALRNSTVGGSRNGTVTLQQFPVAGLSLVETFPSTPSASTLAPNPALIDGNVTASAGVNIGFAPALAGDQNYRDLGVQFANTSTEVTSLWLWVDRALPAEIWRTFAFTVWQSDDNATWIPVSAGSAIFDTFQNRFEIPIASTRARYLKVVTKPLPPAVTVDRQFADILVTELQAYLVQAAGSVPYETSQLSGVFNGSLRWLILRDWNLAYGFALNASHLNDFVPRDWSVLNTFSASRPIARSVSVSAQVERTDSAQTNRPHEAVNRWGVQLSWLPIPGIGTSLTYSGFYSTLSIGNVFSNGLMLTASFDPYQGVSLFGTAGYNWTRNERGEELNGANATVGLTLTPMQALTLTGTWGLNTSLPSATGATLLLADRTTLLQASLTFTPVAALYFNAGVTRSTGTSQGPQTLANFSAGFSPFAGGQLLIRFGWDEWLDSQSQSRNRIFGPSVRWNIRSGTYLNVSYTWNDTVQPLLLQQARTLFAQLVITLN
jgi:hypothetical protein